MYDGLSVGIGIWASALGPLTQPLTLSTKPQDPLRSPFQQVASTSCPRVRFTALGRRSTRRGHGPAAVHSGLKQLFHTKTFRIPPAGSRPALIWNIVPDTERPAFAHSTSYCTQTWTSVKDTVNRFWWADDLLKGAEQFALEMGQRCTFSWLRNSGFGPLRSAIKPTNWTKITFALIRHNQGGEKTEHEIEWETRQRINEPLIPKHKHSFAPTHIQTL